METEKNFGRLAKLQKSELNFDKVNPSIARKVKLIAHPGDFVLETEKFNKVINNKNVKYFSEIFNLVNKMFFFLFSAGFLSPKR